MAKILVSACLIGCCTRYLGDSRTNSEVMELSSMHTLIPVCPEQLGGMSTPRKPSEIQADGRVINSAGEDVSANYRLGAETALHIYNVSGAELAILKANSPSCGKDHVYDGSFSGTLTAGRGVTAELFAQKGIEVFTELELDALKERLK